MAEREGFEPSVSKKDTHDFQSCLFSQLQHLSTKAVRDSKIAADGRHSSHCLHDHNTPLSHNIKIQYSPDIRNFFQGEFRFSTPVPNRATDVVFH